MQSAFTSRREQLESVSSTRERSVNICSRFLPLDEKLYLAPSASGLGSNPGEGMNVCKCIVLNSRRKASPLVWLVEEEEMWETSDNSQSGVLPLNWGGTKPNRTVTCMMLKATANGYGLAQCFSNLGVVWKSAEVSSGVDLVTLDRGLDLRGTSPKALA
ncbi:hypothetical protein TNCV_2532971 [Trichonephila clavipes]|nr:hypothetical protein TNCV_2532971 [Trichonephila clavipes]